VNICYFTWHHIQSTHTLHMVISGRAKIHQGKQEDNNSTTILWHCCCCACGRAIEATNILVGPATCKVSYCNCSIPSYLISLKPPRHDDYPWHVQAVTILMDANHLSYQHALPTHTVYTWQSIRNCRDLAHKASLGGLPGDETLAQSGDAWPSTSRQTKCE
jgi:hypothetical protein